ncbi:MAG: fimbrial protein [Comamonadaceae bacterium]|nr:MAG: fimbrial protein [Comamonadaceae bacterium]
MKSEFTPSPVGPEPGTRSIFWRASLAGVVAVALCAPAMAAEVSIAHTGPAPIEAADNLVSPDASAYWPQAPANRVHGIARIAPVQAVPVTAPVALDAQVEVPTLVSQCALLADEGGVSGVSLDVTDPWDKLLIEKCAEQENGWMVASRAPEPVYVLGLQTQPRPVMTASGTLDYKPAGRKPILRPLASRSGTQYTERNIVRRQADGPSVAFGSVLTRAPAWTDATRIGGVQLSNWRDSSNGLVAPGEFGYSSMVGVLDYTDVAATSGGYQYGATVGSSSLRYGLTRDLTLESHLEAAPSLSAVGMGSSYSLGDMGVLQAGATQSAHEATTAVRTRLGYSVSVAGLVDVGYTNEQIGAGYNDLADYRSGAAPENQVRNSISAGVPMGRYGTLSGTYSGRRGSSGYVERRYGFNHQVDLSNTVAMGLGADRDSVSGDYAMHMTLAMPVDAFLGRLGLYR